MAGRRSADAPGRHRHGLARHHVPLPGAARYFQWLLLLPLAIPTYIIAYTYLELLDYSGHRADAPARDCSAGATREAYWFPDIRSLGGAILVMSAVLYPYVYITARASFIAQSVCVLEVSRTLGRTAAETFWQVALPLARPALAAGVALALMETLNDIGAVEFFGVRTLTVAVYDTWLDRNSLAGAAQIACVMLLFVVRAAACRARRSGPSGASITPPANIATCRKTGSAARAALLAVLACTAAGAARLRVAGRRARARRARPCRGGVGADFWQAALNSLLLAARGRRARRGLRRSARLCAPADALEARSRAASIAARHQLCGPRHRARHRPAHSARRPRQLRSTARCARCSASRPGCCSRARHSPSCSPTRSASSPPRSARWRRGLSKISRNIDAAARDARRLGQRDAVQGASAPAQARARRRGPARVRRFDEGAARDASAQAVQLRHAGHPGVHARLALSLRGGRAVGAHHRGGQPSPGAAAARDHRRQPARGRR